MVPPDDHFLRCLEVMAAMVQVVADQNHIILQAFKDKTLPPNAIREPTTIGRPDSPADAAYEYHSIFLSHTADDKPFVRRLRNDLLEHGVEHVWLDDEIQIGDSITFKISEGIKLSRYVGVVLSAKSVASPWVKKELDIAMNREIDGGKVVVLPLLYEKCELPEFLKGKLHADFSTAESYKEALGQLLRRLRIDC